MGKVSLPVWERLFACLKSLPVPFSWTGSQQDTCDSFYCYLSFILSGLIVLLGCLNLCGSNWVGYHLEKQFFVHNSSFRLVTFFFFFREFTPAIFKSSCSFTSYCVETVTSKLQCCVEIQATPQENFACSSLYQFKEHQTAVAQAASACSCFCLLCS